MKEILIVEDTEIIREFLKDELESSGYQVQAVEDGTKAFQYLTQHPVDAVITDYSMPPGESGLELTQKAREHGFKGPIILFCLQERMEVQRVLDAGANVALEKPKDFDKLIGTLKELLQ